MITSMTLERIGGNVPRAFGIEFQTGVVRTVFSAGRGAVLKDVLFQSALAVPVGAISAYGALAFILLISKVQTLLYGFGHDLVHSAVPTLETWRVLLAPVAGGLLVGLLTRWVVPGRQTYGPADAMQAVHEHDGRMPLNVGLSSAAVSALSIGAGASVGRYGPAVHLGATLGSWLAVTLNLDRSRRLALLGSGVAAAIAASFNAPLAGVVFASEVMLGGRALRSFIPITIAAVVATAIARLHLGEFSIFAIADHAIEHTYEYPLFALVGVLGGLLAVAFMKLTLWMMRRIHAYPLPIWAKPMIGGLLLGVIALKFPQVLGLGDEAIREAITHSFPVTLLLVLIAVKLLASSVSFGFGFSGGVFGPALFLGAMLGSALGSVLSLWFPAFISSASIYAVAGMGAVISSVIGAPVTTILIAFELTRSYALTTAVMLSVVFAAMTARTLFPYSFFKYQLRERGVDLDEGREVQLLRSVSVRTLVSSHFVTVSPQLSVAEAEDRHLMDREADLIVVDETTRFLGVITLFDLVEARRDGLAGEPIASIVRDPALVLTADTDLYTAMQTMRDFVGISIPVVESVETPHFIGVVHAAMVIEAYNLAVEEARFEERGAP